MVKTKNNHTINVVFVLAVACAFAASVLMVLMLGVRVYGDIQETSLAEYKERVCLSYITTKIHRSDEQGAIKVADFSGIPALYIEEEFDGVRYNTIIYTYDGWLRELFSEEALALPPESGMAILEVDEVSFGYVKDNLLSIEYTDEAGETHQSLINLRSTEKGGEGL